MVAPDPSISHVALETRDAPNAVWHQMRHVRDVTYRRSMYVYIQLCEL